MARATLWTLGFLQAKATDEERESHEKIEKALKGAFRPEFINRIDEIIMFSPLSLEQMEEIVVLQMKEVQDRLNEHNFTVELTDVARKWLAKKGYDPAFGARPLSVELLGGKFKEGATVIVDVDEEKDKIVFQTSQPVKKKSKQHVEA
jgi:ATP-dependent Clp protease ATP-binding subunit ClpC